jgi:hypothetical protein
MSFLWYIDEHLVINAPLARIRDHPNGSHIQTTGSGYERMAGLAGSS